MTDMTLPKSVTDFLERDQRMLINGDWAQAGSTLDVIDPATEKRITGIADATSADVDAAVAAARKGFESDEWQNTTPFERGRMLNKIADLLEANFEQIAILETLDNGKPLSLSKTVDVQASINCFRYYAGWADKIKGQTYDVSNNTGKFHAFTLREPVGVAALITPWNYPLIMAAMKLGPALAAGCACILKPAEDTSLTAIRLGELIEEAGVPKGVVNIITGRGAISGAALAAHHGVDKVAFTGSTVTGKAIVESALGNLKKVTLELGGKSPNIIMADADLDKAIPGAAMSVFYNTGQTCTAATRLYVQDEIHDEVIERMAEFAKTVKVGGGFEEDAFMGPVVSAKQFERVKGYIEKGQAEGGEIVTGGGRIGDNGYFLEPTIIANTTNDMVVSREEIFGPVIAAQKFGDVEEVVKLANDSDYGLSAAVWTRDISTALDLTKRLTTGQVQVNCAGFADWDFPIGGYKQSGWGRENSFDAVENYLHTKSVAIAY